jgi:lysophospholipase L1-like esterase
VRIRASRVLLFGALAAVLAFLAIEAGGRVLLWKRWGALGWDSTILFEADPVLGYRHHPNGRSFTVRINALGFRGKEFTVERPPGGRRIVAVGGSTTFGTSNAERETYPALLEARLDGEGSRRVEVINAGVAGYFSHHQRLRSDRELPALRPDVVIVFEGWNDFWHAARLGDRWRPNVVDDDMGRGFVSPLYNVSLGYRAFLHLGKRAATIAGRGPDRDLEARYGAAARDVRVFDAFEANLEAIVRRFVDQRIRVVLVRFPCLVRPSMDDRERTRVQALERFWPAYAAFATAQGRLLERIDAVARRHHVAAVDVQGAFDRLPPDERVPLFSDVIHFSRRGNARIAALVHETLRATIER